jgi:hypothetical protein
MARCSILRLCLDLEVADGFDVASVAGHLGAHSPSSSADPRFHFLFSLSSTAMVLCTANEVLIDIYVIIYKETNEFIAYKHSCRSFVFIIYPIDGFEVVLR